ncbi:MMPL family transporter [Bdellovibrio sp. SKB1291214]|uniref:MMPL family transporter n=1 Tax=Bdellovibrio sp. SKB1291214 TaxID=1732569 RepID=UPI000B51B7A9|nr:MMPL family transporter [Bdellovibrio sp. SKB1291214]UYL09603.1 MMPL family transporter [Bdellovibrio sp. SKB1291214]
MRSIKLFSAAIAMMTALFVSSASAKIDDSVDIFFPESLKYLQYSQTEFPVFWWNFIVINPVNGKADFEKANLLCSDLKEYQGKSVKRLICGDDLGGFIGTLEDWAKDLVLRENFNASVNSPAQYMDSLQGALSELSFISSDKKEFFNLKRVDPTDQWQVYLQKSQAMTPAAFLREQGFLLEPQSQRLVIPLQFAVQPKMSNVQDLMDELKKYEDVHLVGAHGASYSNEKQVHEDMEIVSWVGIAVLVGFIAFLVVKGRIGALLLFPPVAIAMFLAGWVTELFYGSIHGLTLAFGSGIVGLAVDYGLHGAFNQESKQTWKSNLVGFLTTLVGLGILAFSGIPLIRQMMVFGTLGIFFGFVIFFLLCKYLPRYFTLKPISWYFPEFKYSGVVIFLMIALGVVGSFNVDLSFDLRRFNYQLAGDQEATNWFFSQGAQRETYLLLHDQKDLNTKTIEEQLWSQANKISYVGLGEYLPSLETQHANIQSWNSSGCEYLRKNLSGNEAKVFAPFVANTCANHKPLQFQDLASKDYLNHLVGQGQFISVFFGETPAQKQLIKEKFPEAHSLVESIKGFSDSLEGDLKWMIPAALILSTIVLLIYYRNFYWVIAAYIPFMSGLGLFYIANFFKGGSLDLISVLGLLMVFGFSIDYGVFVTDFYAFKQPEEEFDIIQSVLGLAALTNVIGFFPMVFAKHPILHQLGFALFFGTVGTYLGTRWGLVKFLRLEKKLMKGSKS